MGLLIGAIESFLLGGSAGHGRRRGHVVVLLGEELQMRKALLLVVCAAGVAAITGFTHTGKALAYGSADQPVAQVEISGNCDNPSFSFCSDVVGVGGVWAWAELDNVPSSTVSGWNEMDATAAFCHHTQGAGGPGLAGGGGGPDPFGVWQEFPSLTAALAATHGAAEPLLFLGGGNPYTGAVYVLDFFPGSGSDDFMPVVPVTQGHYSAHPATGVSLQVQVAP